MIKNVHIYKLLSHDIGGTKIIPMYKTKFYKMISNLSKIERNRFIKFVNSPYFNVNNHLIGMVEIVSNWFLKPPKNESKEALWSSIFPNQPFHDQKFRKLCSDGLQLLEEFLSVESYLSNKILESTIRLEATNFKKWSPIFRTNLQKLKTRFNRDIELGTERYYYQYKMEQSIYGHSEYNIQRFKVSNIESIIGNLDIFYISEKLRLTCEILSRKTFTKYEYRNTFIHEILEQIEHHKFLENPVISIYYQIVKTHLEPEKESHYYQLKELLSVHRFVLPPWQLKEVFNAALNYCNRKINAGRFHFLSESLQLYQDLISRELIFTDGYLSHWTFKNVVILALRLKEFDWAESFIKDYQHRIPESFRQNAVIYNMATVHFYKKQFSEVLDLLQEVEYEDVTYNLGVKSMLFATYYELSEWEAIHALGESFKVYLHRKKDTIPQNRRDSYLNLIKYVFRLIKCSPGDKETLEDLEEKMNSTKNIASAIWLKEKITERKNMRRE